MTLKQALAFRLPNGKTITGDWLEAYALLEDNEEMPATEETKQRDQASLDRVRDFHEAMEVIIDENHYDLPNFREANKALEQKKD